MSSKNRKWIQDAIRKPGALTSKAKKAKVGLTKSGTISKKFLDKASKSKDSTTRKQANLAKTLKKMKKK